MRRGPTAVASTLRGPLYGVVVRSTWVAMGFAVFFVVVVVGKGRPSFRVGLVTRW
jgi:hypothetical protein